MKKEKLRKVIILICVFIVILLLAIYANFNRQIISNLYEFEKQEEELELFSYVVYDNQDNENIKVLVIVNSENGIEYVKRPDGNKVYGNGKNRLAIDYVMSDGNNYSFEIKEKGKDDVTNEEITITENSIENTIKFEKISENQGYKVIEIKNNTELSGYKMYYQIGKNGEWTEGSGKIAMLDYDLTVNNLINEDNTVTITAKMQNSNTGDMVELSKQYEVDTTSTISSLSADSLIDAMEKYDFGTGKFKVTVSDQTYNLKVYSFDENQKIQANTVLGAEEDVATGSTNAQNMIVLKVNGDLTIEEGATLTAYASKSGYGGPKGMMVYCTGTLKNNGTISMTARGAKAEGQNVYMWKNGDGSYEYVPSIGAIGGSSIYLSRQAKNGNKGVDGTNRQTGGGGTGSGRSWSKSLTISAGGTGTSYSGGSGSGAANEDGGGGWYVVSGNGSSQGGAGGNGVVGSWNTSGYGQISMGGTGNPSGSYATYRISPVNYVKRDGTGGLLIIYSQNISNNGRIEANGVASSTANSSGTFGRIDTGGASRRRKY